MLRTWTLLIVTFSTTLLFANDSTGPRQSPYYSHGFSTRNGPVEEPPVVPTAIPPVTGPLAPWIPGPSKRSSGLVIEEADPDIEIEGFDPNLSYNKTEDANGPAVAPFKKLFQRCAPSGCTGGQVQVCRARGCRHNHGSCHNSGEAIDLISLRCDGQRYDAYTSKFAQFVRCAGNSQPIDSTNRRGRNWKVLFQEGESNRKGCGGVGAGTPRRGYRSTICHWNHAHISMQCRRSGGWSW